MTKMRGSVLYIWLYIKLKSISFVKKWHGQTGKSLFYLFVGIRGRKTTIIVLPELNEKLGFHHLPRIPSTIYLSWN